MTTSKSGARTSGAAPPISTASKILILIVVGATLGTALDWVHTATGAIAYADPLRVGIAWWTPLIYIGAACGIGLSHPMLDRRLGRPETPPPSGSMLVIGLIGLSAVWAASGGLPLSNVAIGAVIGPASIALFLLLDGTRAGALEALATVLAGVVVEVSLVRLGAFHYVRPDVLGIASWLPWIYVAGSVAGGNLGRRLAAPRVA